MNWARRLASIWGGVPDDYVLTADSDAPFGVKWAPGGGGGSGGDSVTINTVAVTDLDLDNSTPAAPAGALNVAWQKDGSTPANVSGNIPASGLLDVLGNTRGNVLYRGAASWAALAAGTLGYLLTAGGAGADPSWVSPIETVLAAWVDSTFGDASDGDVTLGSNITLTRDMNYDTLDLAGFSIDADGYRIRARRLENSGGSCVISNNGDSAVNRVAGAGTQAHSLGNGTSGGNGGTSGAAGTAGAARTASWPATVLGGNAGDGGAGGASGAGQTGGAKGDATAITWTSGTVGGQGGAYWTDLTWVTTTVNAVNGGAGGGGGGASAAGGSAGGGGGGAGGVTQVNVHTIAANASTVTIQANGGNAGNVAGTAAGGGSGAGGGFAKLIYQVALGTLPTVEALAGSGTNGVGTGVNGGNGNAGVTEIRRLGT